MPPSARLYFDFTDPLSYLADLELAAVESAGWNDAEHAERTSFELRPPPAPLVGPDDVSVAGRWTLAREVANAAGITLARPSLVPWSRKAHELFMHAQAHGLGREIRSRVFEAYLLEGLDIGRVDVLVSIARALGLDATEAKAVLDVDRFEPEVGSVRAAALERGVSDTPLLVVGEARLQGFHERTALRTFLHRAPDHSSG